MPRRPPVETVARTDCVLVDHAFEWPKEGRNIGGRNLQQTEDQLPMDPAAHGLEGGDESVNVLLPGLKPDLAQQLRRGGAPGGARRRQGALTSLACSRLDAEVNTPSMRRDVAQAT